MKKQDLIGKCKRILGIENDDIPEITIYKLLEKLRNRFHPDLTINQEMKNEYQEKFKEINSLLVELGNNLSSKNDVALFNNNILSLELDIINEKNKNINLNDKIIAQNTDIEILKRELENKNNEINKLNNKKVIETKSKIVFEHTVSNKPVYTGMGITFLVGIIINLLDQFEKISKSFYNMFNLDINLFLLICLIMFIIYYSYNQMKKSILNGIIIKIISNSSLREFEDYINIKGRTNSFNEFLVEKFIKHTFSSSNFLRRSLYIALGFNKDYLVNDLKDVFIQNLLSRNIIRLRYTDGVEIGYEYTNYFNGNN